MSAAKEFLRVSAVGLCIALNPILGSSEAHPSEDLQPRWSVPPRLAHITDTYFPESMGPVSSSLPEFILIQDVHRHPEVQARIASLIVYGYERWGVRKVFLEGAFMPVDLSVFHRVPDKTREVLLQRLLKEGNLSGPELAAVQVMEKEWRNPPVSPFQLVGMEDLRLYRKSLAAYREVQKYRPQALQELSSVRRLQASMQLPDSHILAQQLDRTEALLRLKLRPSEYDAFVMAKEAVPSAPQLDRAIRAALNFYRLAHERSLTFIAEAIRKAPAAPGPRLLVAGGFHTSVMAARLRQSGRSYIVLTPRITQAGDEPLYEKRLMETASELAANPVQLAPEPSVEAFAPPTGRATHIP
jgi:hypothetical protein